MKKTIWISVLAGAMLFAGGSLAAEGGPYADAKTRSACRKNARAAYKTETASCKTAHKTKTASCRAMKNGAAKNACWKSRRDADKTCWRSARARLRAANKTCK